jgi:hypothetical protein
VNWLHHIEVLQALSLGDAQGADFEVLTRSGQTRMARLGPSVVHDPAAKSPPWRSLVAGKDDKPWPSFTDRLSAVAAENSGGIPQIFPDIGEWCAKRSTHDCRFGHSSRAKSE